MEMLFKPPLIIAGLPDRRRYPLAPRLYGSRCDKRHIYRLRYRSFLHAGWIGEAETEELSDGFDELPSAFSIGAFYKDNCVGALRLLFGGEGVPQGSMPCEEVFPEAIARITADRPVKLVEFSRMVLDPAVEAKTFRAVIYGSLVRAGLILAYAAEADFAVAAVHQRVSRFYELMCGFGLLAASSSYRDIDEPTHLLGRDFGTLDRRRRARNAFFGILPEEIEHARALLAELEQARENDALVAARKNCG